jgi:hypothetical protein
MSDRTEQIDLDWIVRPTVTATAVTARYLEEQADDFH